MIRSVTVASVIFAISSTLSLAAVEQDVVDQCGAGSPGCADTAETYVSDIAVAGRPDAIVNLTVALVAQAQQDPACNAVDREVAAAIRRIATFADDEQAARLLNIADAVERCEVTETATIAGGPQDTQSPG